MAYRAAVRAFCGRWARTDRSRWERNIRTNFLKGSSRERMAEFIHNIFRYITTKRSKYAHEQEVRAFLWIPDPHAGINRHFDAENRVHPLPLTPPPPYVLKGQRRKVDLEALVTGITALTTTNHSRPSPGQRNANNVASRAKSHIVSRYFFNSFSHENQLWFAKSPTVTGGAMKKTKFLPSKS